MSTHIRLRHRAGRLYAKLRGRGETHRRLWKERQSAPPSICSGISGWLPLLGLTRPLWKQPLPEIVGETMRHMAYGVTTATVYGAINAGINETEANEAIR